MNANQSLGGERRGLSPPSGRPAGINPAARWCALAALLFLSAAPVADIEELLRRGNAAFDREDYAAALGFFTQAEERTTDPGLVAFNKGAALYQLGRYREAELHYRSCLEDAAGPRRARAWYDLGNCLVRRSEGSDPALLKKVVECYDQCLADEAADEDLRARAEANRDLARRLWEEAKDNPPRKPDSDDPENADDPLRKNDGSEQFPELGPDGNPRTGRPGSMERMSADQLRNGQQPTPTDEHTPGKGNRPPVPDSDQLAPLSPEDAANHLRQAAARILRERHEHRERFAPPVSPRVMDW